MNQIEQSREQFDFGLKECVIEASPGFDESLSTLTQENESSSGLFGISSPKGIDGADREKLLICLTGASKTAVLAKLSTEVSQTRKLLPPMSLFSVLSITPFDNALTMASTDNFCEQT